MEFRVAFEALCTESLEDFSRTFYDRFDGQLSERDGRVTVIAYVDGSSAVDAAMLAIEQLERAGLSIVQVDEDLVDCTEIASRLGKSRQAVAHWATGKRGSGFPRPLGTPSGHRIWAWGQITEWLASRGELDEAPSLTHDDAVEVNSYLTRRRTVLTSPTRGGHQIIKIQGGRSKSTSRVQDSADYVHASPGIVRTPW